MDPSGSQLILQHALKACGSNQVHTAKLLGISRNVLRTLLKRHGLLNGEIDTAETEDSSPSYLD